MQFINEEVLQARLILAVKSKSVPSKWLILSAGKSAFFNAPDYAGILQEAISKRNNRAVSVESSDIIADSLISARNLVRLIQKFDYVHLFYSGVVSFNKSILPAAIISRFFGKDISLFYYLNKIEDKIPGSHRLTLKLCKNVYVASRYLQLDLAKLKIKSEVVLRPVTANLLPARIVSQVQPHILVKFNSAFDAGVLCAMKAVGIVKQKYPRTELTVLTDLPHNWLNSSMDAVDFLQRHVYKISYVPRELQSAFAEADVFVNCSPYETLQPALLAAMSSGLPTISIETYGAREIIENGVNGLLIRPNDHSQLADKIIKLTEEPALAVNISKEAVKIRARLGIDNVARLVQ